MSVRIFSEVSLKIEEAKKHGNKVNKVYLSSAYYSSLIEYLDGQQHVDGVNYYPDTKGISGEDHIFLDVSVKSCKECNQGLFYNKQDDEYYCPACE